MEEKKKGRISSWAELRFSIIAGLLVYPPEQGKLQEELKGLAARTYQNPDDGRPITFGVSTIERWYYKAVNTQNTMEALGRKVRSDAGSRWAMSDELLAALGKQYERYPQWSYKLHADNLNALVEESPHLGRPLSYATVWRRMSERGWVKKPLCRTEGQRRAAERRQRFETRGFESAYVNALWHLDFHEGRRLVDANGRWHTPKALCVLDDCSRLGCHIQWYLHESAETLIHGLTQAFHKRGLPRGLMTDNGAAMLAHETVNGLMRLGIDHRKTLPYSPNQNGKQESFWAHLEGRLLAMLSELKPLTLEFLNQTSQAWLEQEYNRGFHDDLCCSPLERFLKGPDTSRSAPSSEEIRFAFTVQERRTQRKGDGSVSIKGVRFEIPSRFRHFRHLWVRYQSWDLSRAYLVDERTGDLLALIHPQDKIKNASGKRRALDYPAGDNQSAPPIDNTDPIPPLLRKILAQYAATGLPPAYLPKEELPESNNSHREDSHE